MFKNLIDRLNAISETTEVSIPLEHDAEGYLDKECPSESCLFGFKIHREDWSAIVRDEEVFCPACRHGAPATSWYTQEQIHQAKQYALNSIKGAIGDAMRQDAIEWNRKQPRNAFLKMTLSVEGSPAPALVPVAASEPMRLRTTCEKCQCRYSYVGAAFFCPSCGANSATHTFQQTLRTIRAASTCKSSLEQSFDADQANVLYRALLEKALQDAVTSFQRLCEQIYEAGGWPRARRNAFQNLDEGAELWNAAIGKGYGQLLGAADIAKLQFYFQQRHLIAHQQGIVDQSYISRTGDRSYQLGQRLTLNEAAVLEFADLIERLGTALVQAVEAA